MKNAKLKKEDFDEVPDNKIKVRDFPQTENFKKNKKNRTEAKIFSAIPQAEK